MKTAFLFENRAEQEERKVLNTGDKIINAMKEAYMDLSGLVALSHIHENTLLEILSGIEDTKD